MVNVPSEVIEAASKGDQEAFTTLVEAYQTPVYNLCYRMLFNEGEAEEAAQETFWKAWTNFSNYDHSRSFSTWILSIAAHYCIDQQRKKRVPETEIDDTMEEIIPEKGPMPEQEVVRNEENEHLQKMLKSLSDLDRATVIMKYWNDMSDKEIADGLSLTESAVKSRLFRARKQLADNWKEEIK